MTSVEKGQVVCLIKKNVKMNVCLVWVYFVFFGLKQEWKY